MPGPMVKRKHGPPPKINWEQAFERYVIEEVPKGITQAAYAAAIGVNSCYFSTKFTSWERERELTIFKRRTPNLLNKALDNVEKTLKEDAEYVKSADRAGLSPQFKAEFSLDAVKAFAGMEGISPQGAIINIQNKATATVLAPMFAGQTDEIRNLLGGDDDSDLD